MPKQSLNKEVRKLTGLLIGTRWESEIHERPITFARARAETPNDTQTLTLEIKPSGRYNAFDAYTDIQSGSLTPVSSTAKDVRSFVRAGANSDPPDSQNKPHSTEKTFVCADCGTEYNTNGRHCPLRSCYECGADTPWTLQET